jgi:hypothetical protein
MAFSKLICPMSWEPLKKQLMKGLTAKCCFQLSYIERQMNETVQIES